MTEPMYCDHEGVCVFLNQDGEPHCKRPVGKCKHDTRARGPVAQQAPAITLPKDMTNLQCIDEGLKGLSDYFNAAIEGGESKAALRRMWDQQMGIMFALLKNYQQAPAIISVEPHPPGAEQLRCDNTCPARTPICEKGCPLAEHDAALIAQAREDVLKELYLLAEDMISDGQRMIREEPGKYRCGTCGRLNKVTPHGCPYFDESDMQMRSKVSQDCGLVCHTDYHSELNNTIDYSMESETDIFADFLSEYYLPAKQHLEICVEVNRIISELKKHNTALIAHEKESVLDQLIHEYDSGDHPEISDCDTSDEWYGYGWDDCRDAFVQHMKSLRPKVGK